MITITLIFIALFLECSSASSYQSPTCPIEEQPECAVRCPEVDQPICAISLGWNGGLHTFGYMCQMNGYNCNCPTYPYEFIHDGPCARDCTQKLACPRIHKPICATPVGFCGQPKMFSNYCTLINYNCSNKKKYQFLHAGDCKKKNCPDTCADLYAPICALPDGFCSKPKTFGNSCYLLVNNCKEEQKYKYLHTGVCLTGKEVAT